MTAGRTLVLGVTGSIAAYKSAELIRLMVSKKWNVRVIMTSAAKHFVGEMTFRTLSRNPVATSMFDEVKEWVPGHLSFAEHADVFLVAPCTANVLAKMAYGLADDLISSTALATKAPVLVAPAMNSNMWDHPATQANIKILNDRGVSIIEPGEGDLACGYQGRGRMAEPSRIACILEDIIKEKS